MPFERIVRPYQTPEVTPQQIEYAPGAAGNNAPIKIRPGLVGRTKDLIIACDQAP
jgi:hypothetical protein